MNKSIFLFIGNMGSGKSEVAINFTLRLTKEGKRPVKLLDLDLIKPYIRIRDISEKLSKAGIDLIEPYGKLKNADMPIVPGRIMDYIMDDSYDLVLDVGGEERGVITIAQFAKPLKEKNLEVNLIINTLRPFSRSIEQIISVINSLEYNSKLKITGLVSNTHLRFESTIEEAYKGYEIISSVSRELNIPIKFVCIWDKLLNSSSSNEIRDKFKGQDILPLKLFLTFPWELDSSV